MLGQLGETHHLLKRVIGMRSVHDRYVIRIKRVGKNPQDGSAASALLLGASGAIALEWVRLAMRPAFCPLQVLR